MVLKLPYMKLVRLNSYQKVYLQKMPLQILWGHFFELKKPLELALSKTNQI
jgi:hypothetical protein